MTLVRQFAARIDALPELVAFSAEAFAQESVDASLLPAVDLVLEELFTNVVRHGGRAAHVQVELRGIDRGVEVVVQADGVEPYDVTKATPVDVGAPLQHRQPGGLGLHLIRQMVDSLEYQYQGEMRRSRVTFRKTSS